MDAADWTAATPADRARAAQQALGTDALVRWCADLVTGTADLLAEPDPDPRWLAARAWTSWGDPATWAGRELDYWPRVWAARTLLYVWDPTAEGSVTAGLDDDHWRVREMCAKLVARHELGSAADACARLAGHDDTPRVRVAALRALAVTGESEHAPAVLAGLDDPEPAVAGAADRARTAMERRLDRSLG